MDRKHNPDDFLMLTTPPLPFMRVRRVLGVVSASQRNDDMTVHAAFLLAQKKVHEVAKGMGANGIVGMAFSTAGTQYSVTASVWGTAVVWDTAGEDDEAARQQVS